MHTAWYPGPGPKTFTPQDVLGPPMPGMSRAARGRRMSRDVTAHAAHGPAWRQTPDGSCKETKGS